MGFRLLVVYANERMWQLRSYSLDEGLWYRWHELGWNVFDHQKEDSLPGGWLGCFPSHYGSIKEDIMWFTCEKRKITNITPCSYLVIWRRWHGWSLLGLYSAKSEKGNGSLWWSEKAKDSYLFIKGILIAVYTKYKAFIGMIAWRTMQSSQRC